MSYGDPPEMPWNDAHGYMPWLAWPPSFEMRHNPALGWVLPDDWLNSFLPPRMPLWFWEDE